MSPPPPAGDAHAASPARFGVLAAYCCASFLCAGAWNTLAPIYAIAQARFQVSASAVTLVALSMFLTYVPGSVLALFLTARHGLRATLLTGAALQTAMCALKWAGVALCAAPHGAYALLLAGQLLGGLGQPLILNVVARLTMDWCVRRKRRNPTCSLAPHQPRRLQYCARRSRSPSTASRRAGSRPASVTWRRWWATKRQTQARWYSTRCPRGWCGGRTTCRASCCCSCCPGWRCSR